MSLSIFPNLAEDATVTDYIQILKYNPNVDVYVKSMIINQSGFDFSYYTGDETDSSLQGLYEGSNNTFTADIQFSTSIADANNPGEYVTAPCDVTLINYSSVPSFSATNVDSKTVRITGKALGVFTEQHFRFLMKDKTVKELAYNTTEDFLALVGWAPPPITVKNLIHNFLVQVNYQSQTQQYSAITNVSIPQTVVWSYSSGIASFRNALSRGKI